MARTKMDPVHIQQCVFDEDTESNKVKLVGTEIEIELSADDGDSVISRPMSVSFSTKDIPMKCDGMKSVCVYIKEGTITVRVSPEDQGEFWIDLITAEQTSSIAGICARRIQMTGTGEGVLVMQAV